MYNHSLYKTITDCCEINQLDISGLDKLFYTRLVANTSAINRLYSELYDSHTKKEMAFEQLIQTIIHAHKTRSAFLKQKDIEKEKKGNWFLSNEIVGMSLYVDRFCGTLNILPTRLNYLTELGVNLLHLMPVFESPPDESDGGYAVSNFRKVDERYGTLQDLQDLENKMQQQHMFLMIDIVLNHTSQQHEWAKKARNGDVEFQQYFYMYDDRSAPDQFELTMPEIFPESSSGNFTYIKELNKWVMSVFHDYQWDLNYSNPVVLNAMLDNIFFYANLGVDILRIDAPAFIWKQVGTCCQNLPKAHSLLQLIKQCVQVAAPGMVLLGEAIVAPKEIMKYFGSGLYVGKECDVTYNATQMALQWDALATGETRVMQASQNDLLQKPFGNTWINYTRCHDDIGLGFEDSSITAAGFNPYEHRKFLKEYYSGKHPGSPATGALFSVNTKTQDARISGSLASLCGLETAIKNGNQNDIDLSIKKLLLMQGMSCFIGGIPMLFYGDEVGYINDYSYLNDDAKSYDNRWMHRPLIDWSKNERIHTAGSVEAEIYHATKRLIQIRKKLSIVSDLKNLTWLPPYNIHVAGFLRTFEKEKLYCLFNFSNKTSYITWYAFKEEGIVSEEMYDHWTEKNNKVGADHEYFEMEPYSFCLLEAKVY